MFIGSINTAALPHLHLWRRYWGKETSIKEAFIVALAAVAFLVAGVWNLRLPGLHYDEVLFVNAALLGKDSHFIHSRVLGLPFMVMPYIGALKSYVFLPIFAVFGVSIRSIRVSTLLISCVALLIAHVVMRRFAGRWLATAFTLMLAFDAVFVFYSRFDMTVVMMMVLKVAAIACLLAWLKSGKPTALWGFVACCTLGLWDKLNFIWFIIAIIPSLYLAYGTRAVRRTREHKSALTAWAALAVLVVGVGVLVILPLFRAASGGSFDPLVRLDLVNQTLDGRVILLQVTGERLEMHSPIVGITLAALLIAAVSGIPRLARASQARMNGADDSRRALIFFATCILLITAQILMTREAGGPHHAMMIYPLHYFAIIGAFAWIRRMLKDKVLLNIQKVFTWIICLAIILTNLSFTCFYLSAFTPSRHFVAIWTPAITKLAEVVQQSDPQSVITTDWGLYNQLLVLSPAVRSINTKADLWPTFINLYADNEDTQAKTRGWIYDTFFKGRARAVLISRVEDAAVMKNTGKNTVVFTESLRDKIKCDYISVPEVDGKAMFEVRVCQAAR